MLFRTKLLGILLVLNALLAPIVVADDMDLDSDYKGYSDPEPSAPSDNFGWPPSSGSDSYDTSPKYDSGAGSREPDSADTTSDYGSTDLDLGSDF